MPNFDNRQLLCTFTNTIEFRDTAVAIQKFYNVYNNRIFTFSNVKNPNELYLTYNVINMQKHDIKFPNTILIHRKKQTNTLYTLNSMNRLIEEETGKIDHSYIIDWTLYENSLIITGENGIRVISLKIFNILD